MLHSFGGKLALQVSSFARSLLATTYGLFAYMAKKERQESGNLTWLLHVERCNVTGIIPALELTTSIRIRILTCKVCFKMVLQCNGLILVWTTDLSCFWHLSTSIFMNYAFHNVSLLYFRRSQSKLEWTPLKLSKCVITKALNSNKFSWFN